jgi:hypothetical protein
MEPMKNQKAIVIVVAWVIALGVVVWAYRRTAAKPITTGPYPSVIVPPQNTSQPKQKTAAEIELEQKERALEEMQIEELKAAVERANKSGKHLPDPPTPKS